MAELEVRFTLDERDLRHLRRLMRRAGAAAARQPEAKILAAARGVAAEIRKFKPPDFVVARLEPLETLIDLLEDPDYRAPGRVRRRVLASLAYFALRDDLIPDSVPGLGFLDDAILIELLARELGPELRAYRDFRVYRERAVRSPEQLAERRRRLRQRVAAAEVRSRTRAREGSFRLW